MSKPSQFSVVRPYGSVLQTSEGEIVAKSIMMILARLGDVWQDLSWEQYAKERQKDGNFSNDEKAFFDKAIPYCRSAEMAKRFAPAWREIK